MIEALKNYYREKRIRRILSFYHEIQPFILPLSDSAHRKVRFISRDAWIQFILTIFLLLTLSRFTGYFIAAFLAIEISDFIMIRGSKFFDAIFDYVLPIGFLLLVGIFYFGTKHYNLAGNLKERFQKFHKEKNKELATRIQKNISAIGIGENWAIEEFSDGNVKPLNLEEARLACRKRAYKIYDGESFNFNPPLLLNTSAYFWYEGKHGTMGASLGPGQVMNPKAFVGEGNTEPYHLTLCVKP